MVNHNKSPCEKKAWSGSQQDNRQQQEHRIKGSEGNVEVGMQSKFTEHTEAVRKYYAAFPALKRGEDPAQLHLPPAWCRNSIPAGQNMQTDLFTKDWNAKKKFSWGKERRNSFHGQRRHKKRCHGYSRSLESKENLPEWVTHEAVWDMDSQDPVREFIRAIALDEGYGTCENTLSASDELREITNMKVPEWDDGLRLDACAAWLDAEELGPQTARTPVDEELYARFEAKFDSSIEALWAKEPAATPDDDYQDLPIDFHDLLSSPSDRRPPEPSAADKCSMISLTESIWSGDPFDSLPGGGAGRADSPTRSVDTLRDRFQPLNLADELCAPEGVPPARTERPFSLFHFDDAYDAVPSVGDAMHSLVLLNHSKSSSFAEVIPRRPSERAAADEEPEARDRPAASPPRPDSADSEPEDLLTSARTHFRPIRRVAATSSAKAPVRYEDGTTFDIRGDLDPIAYQRSESGSLYLERDGAPRVRLLDCHASDTIDYGRMKLTDAQRASGDLGDRFGSRLKFAVCQNDRAVQTEGPAEAEAEAVVVAVAAAAWVACDECARLAGAKKMRQSGIGGIWSAEEARGEWCGSCAARAPPAPPPPPPPPADELSREWEELLSDISAAHAQYAGVGAGEAGDSGSGAGGEEPWYRGDRKRRHSTALRCPRPHGPCTHPHAPFLHCCSLDRPLTR